MTESLVPLVSAWAANPWAVYVADTIAPKVGLEKVSGSVPKLDLVGAYQQKTRLDKAWLIRGKNNAALGLGGLLIIMGVPVVLTKAGKWLIGSGIATFNLFPGATLLITDKIIEHQIAPTPEG